MRKLKKFAVIDAETDPFLFGRNPKPFLWGYFDGDKYLSFTDTKKFAVFLSEQKITCYAHNGGKFDFMYLLDYINNYEQLTIINGRLSKARMGKCTLQDSYNILPVALADYQKDKIDYAKFEEKVRDKYMNEIGEYLRSDCMYLHELVTRYRVEYGADLTQASGAMKTWQKMKGEKAPRHNDKALFAHFKNYYHGGRVQCFQSGIIDKKFSLYDINSAYPFSMMYKHPYGMGYLYGDREIPFNPDVRVFYRLTCVSDGAFPYREKANSGLSFPDDEIMREYHVTDWEYWTAKNAGLVRYIKIIECVVFTDTMDFSNYVSRFYEARKQAKADGDKARDLLYKLRLNSLYGKFGSDYRKYEHHIKLPDNMECDDWGKVDSYGEGSALFTRKLTDDEMKFYNVNTSASITGFVRAYLLAAMVRMGRKNLLYCDTDCIATLSAGDIQTGDELGAWKHEGDFIRGGIAGKKLYVFKPEKGACKKASKGAILSDAQLWKICKGGEVEYKKDAPAFSVTGKIKFVKRTIKMTI